MTNYRQTRVNLVSIAIGILLQCTFILGIYLMKDATIHGELTFLEFCGLLICFMNFLCNLFTFTHYLIEHNDDYSFKNHAKYINNHIVSIIAAFPAIVLYILIGLLTRYIIKFIQNYIDD